MKNHLRQKKMGNLDGMFRGGICVLILGLATLNLTGCTRRFYRQGADREVSEVLSQKDQYPDWGIEQQHVYPDSRARFADPTDPDHPPKPPDDPAARDLSPNPQKPGKAGIAYLEGAGYLDLLAAWDAENRKEEKSPTETNLGQNRSYEDSRDQEKLPAPVPPMEKTTTPV